MTSFLYDIGDKNRAIVRFISDVNSELQSALVSEKRKRKLTQQAIADALDVNRSVINRRFMGLENMTLKSVAELAWVLGREINFSLEEEVSQDGGNERLKVDSPPVAFLTGDTGVSTSKSSTMSAAKFILGAA